MWNVVFQEPLASEEHTEFLPETQLKREKLSFHIYISTPKPPNPLEFAWFGSQESIRADTDVT